MKTLIVLIAMLLAASGCACTILYYIDESTGNIYVANNEDYWYDVDPYVQINTGKKNELSRLWFGWKNFGQGGINEAGVFFDGAVTPTDTIPEGFGTYKGNFTDDILAQCKTANEVLGFFEEHKLALDNAHVLIGDSTGAAFVLEWVGGVKHVLKRESNYLLATNYLLSDSTRGNYPCYRYKAVEDRIMNLPIDTTLDFLAVSNLIGGAAQAPRAIENDRVGGTLYSTFIDVTNMQLVIVPKLDNSKVLKLDLTTEFNKRQKRKIPLD